MAALVAVALSLALTVPPPGLRVCKNTACKKSGSADTLETLFFLASTSSEANENAAKAAAAHGASSPALAALQASFAASRVEASGCLGKCGSGPNCAATDSEELFHDVYKPKSCVALLAHVDISVPEAAQRAWLRRMYAMRAMRANKHTEARALLTEALNEASSLRGNAAHMLQALLELRADVHDALGDAPKAVSDRERAASMRAMLPEGSKEPAGAAA